MRATYTIVKFILAIVLLVSAATVPQKLTAANPQVESPNLIANGNFEAGNSGFTSEYAYSLTAEQDSAYNMTSNPANIHPAASWYGDHTSGTGLMMMLNGSTQADAVAWSQTVAVSPNTQYEFSGWISSWYSGSPARVEVRINGNAVGTIKAPLAAARWENFAFNWNSQSATSATVELIDLNLDAGGNDFSLDDLSLLNLDIPCLGLTQEAENGLSTGNWTVGSDAAASDGKYIYAPAGSGDFWNGTNSQQRVRYCFDVPLAGTYHIKGKVYAASDLSDSFYVTVDGAPGTGYLWDLLRNASYAMDYVNDRHNADPVEVQLSAGQHFVTIYLRESGARLDTIELEPVTTQPIPTCAGLVQEAETAVINGNWSVEADSTASGGAYIHTENGSGDSWNGANPSQKASFCFNVDISGTYRIRGKVYGADSLSDSFYVQVDSSPPTGYLWDILPNTFYASDYVSDRGVIDPVEIDLLAGAHIVTVFVREDGARLDTLELQLIESNTPGTPLCAGLIQEAESGVLKGNFAVGNSTSASGGQYIYTANGSGDFWSQPSHNHKAEYCFNVDTAGTYRIDGKVYGADSLSDSFYVQVNGAPTGGYLWDILANTSYLVDSLSDRNHADPVLLPLSSGTHTVTVFVREDGARLDTIQLVASPSSATGRAMSPLAAGVGGTVRLDGVKLTSEIDFSQFTITLLDVETNGAEFSQQVQADRFGNYHFDGMMPGSYLVQIQTPSGLVASTSSATITATAAEPVEADFVVSGAGGKTYLPLISR